MLRPVARCGAAMRTTTAAPPYSLVVLRELRRIAQHQLGNRLSPRDLICFKVQLSRFSPLRSPTQNAQQGLHTRDAQALDILSEAKDLEIGSDSPMWRSFAPLRMTVSGAPHAVIHPNMVKRPYGRCFRAGCGAELPPGFRMMKR